VPETLSRILNVFPHEEHLQVAATLLSSLRLIISQRLLPHPSGKGRTALREYMAFTPEIRESLLDTPPERLIPKTEELLATHGRRIQDAARRAYGEGAISRDWLSAIMAERERQPGTH
jgi:defect-in-organelle-trafficking protein DotB